MTAFNYTRGHLFLVDMKESQWKQASDDFRDQKKKKKRDLNKVLRNTNKFLLTEIFWFLWGNSKGNKYQSYMQNCLLDDYKGSVDM